VACNAGASSELMVGCRIDRLPMGEELVVLCISGRLTAQDGGVLWDLLAQESGPVAIDLKGVLLVDREIVRLLALTEANGVELRNCPAFIAEWIRRERAQTNEPRGEGEGKPREDVEDV
jgi:hypothetical protein